MELHSFMYSFPFTYVNYVKRKQRARFHAIGSKMGTWNVPKIFTFHSIYSRWSLNIETKGIKQVCIGKGNVPAQVCKDEENSKSKTYLSQWKWYMETIYIQKYILTQILKPNTEIYVLSPNLYCKRYILYLIFQNSKFLVKLD